MYTLKTYQKNLSTRNRMIHLLSKMLTCSSTSNIASTMGTIIVVAAAFDTHMEINMVTNVRPKFNLEE